MTTPETKTCGTCKYWHRKGQNVFLPICNAPLSLPFQWHFRLEYLDEDTLRFTQKTDGADCPAYQPKEATDARDQDRADVR